MTALVIELLGRCGCGKAAAKLVGEDLYCRRCLPSGSITLAEHRRLFALLISHGVARATANAMLIRKLDFEREIGMEFE